MKISSAFTKPDKFDPGYNYDISIKCDNEKSYYITFSFYNPFKLGIYFIDCFAEWDKNCIPGFDFFFDFLCFQFRFRYNSPLGAEAIDELDKKYGEAKKDIDNGKKLKSFDDIIDEMDEKLSGDK